MLWVYGHYKYFIFSVRGSILYVRIWWLWTSDSEHSEQHYLAVPADTTRWPNAGLMLAHRLRRWANINPALGQRVVFAGVKHVFGHKIEKYLAS